MNEIIIAIVVIAVAVAAFVLWRRGKKTGNTTSSSGSAGTKSSPQVNQEIQ